MTRYSRYLTAFQTIFTKELLRFTRIWLQTILPPVITTVLYYIIFGNLIGSRIGEMDGFSYIDFIVPGLILMAVITNSYSNVVSSFFSSKFQRHVEELIISPVPNWVILAGWMLILSDAFIQRFPNRIVNLHPALPGQFPGTHAIERAFDESAAAKLLGGELPEAWKPLAR